MFQEDTMSFDQQSPASAFCERTACLFTILGQVTAEPKKNTVSERWGNKIKRTCSPNLYPGTHSTDYEDLLVCGKIKADVL
jgi:hypothetical protein